MNKFDFLSEKLAELAAEMDLAVFEETAPSSEETAQDEFFLTGGAEWLNCPECGACVDFSEAGCCPECGYVLEE